MKKIALLILLTLFVTATNVVAGDLWMIDTRPASVASPDADNYHRISFERWDGAKRRFVPSTRGEFLETCDDVPILFLFHGNWMKRAEAVTIARDFYRRIEKEKCRVVMWTWPSERIDARPRVDIKVKAYRADQQASYIVWFLRELRPNSRVALAGFSFGARLIAMALEELSTYDDKLGIELNAILMAAAFDSKWLLPGQRLENAVSVAGQCDILYNPDDDRLCFYPFVDSVCGHGPTALGATGLPVSNMSPSDQPRVRSINVSRWIGMDHSFTSSLRSMMRYGNFRKLAFLEE
ncbi:MAG: hypothetical protein ACRC46_14910 [Thermoguttaceae bacterium]